MSLETSPVTVLGFDDSNRAAGIPRKDQIHTAIFGEVGSGKSIVNTILISQNIRRDEGFIVLDPHGSLARDVLRMVPHSQRDRVVYISLDSVARWGKTVKINPLEVKSGKERYLIVMNLVNALKNIYHDSWGPQLEALLRNGANALVEIEGSTLRDLVKIITDERMRAIYINKVSNHDVKNFWTVLFPQQYQKDAGRSAYNKLDKILSIPQVAAMFDTPQSTIDFADVMESGKWVIIDLSSGGSDDVVSFVGTILINMVYVEAKRRFAEADVPPKPFFMYIDEAHLFAPFVLRELLNTMRKANVKVAVTSQTINTFPREFAREVSALARTIACFKVDGETAAMFKTIMPVPVDLLTSMSHGRFAFYSQGDPPLSGLLKVFPIVDRARDWKDLAQYSVDRCGMSTSLEKYIVHTKERGEVPDVAPLEAAILLLLYNESRQMARDEICDLVQKMFDATRRDVFEKLDDILVNKLRLVEKKNTRAGDAFVWQYCLSSLAYNSIFSQAAAGRRAGSDLHLSTIFIIMRMQQRNFKFCIPDLGDSARQRPDLLIFEPAQVESGKARLYDPLRWLEKAIAVEVETDPTKHQSQVIKNFQKNYELGYDVWFVVFAAGHRDYIEDAMSKAGIGRQLYKTVIILPESVERLANVQKDGVVHLTREELEVYNALGGGRTATSVAERVGLSSYDVMAVLWRLEKKGAAERGYAETKVTEINPASGRTSTVTRRQEYFMPTGELDKPRNEPGDKTVGHLEGDAGDGKDDARNITPEQEPFDFTKLSDEALTVLIPHPRYGNLAKKLLENRASENKTKT